MPRFLVFLILFVVAFGCYSNSLHNNFVLDDHAYFADTTMSDLKFVPYHFLLGKGISVFGFEKNSNKGYYRPLSSTVHTCMNVFFEGNLVYYHAANIFFLSSVGFLIYIILNSFFPEVKTASFLAGLLFVMHPLNSCMINYVGLGIYLFQAALILLALWFVAGRNEKHCWWSGVFLILAAFCHESSLALPVYALVLLLALKLPVWRRIWPVCLASVAYFIFSLIRTSMVENLLRNSPVSSMHLSLFAYLSTFGHVAFWYIARLFFPTDIVFMWGMPIAFSLWGIIFLLVVILGAAALLKRFWETDNRVMFLGTGWMLSAFVPGVLGGIGRPGMICVEPHWVIFASIGFCICVANMFVVKNRAFSWAICVLIAFSWFCLDREYNTLWANEKTYCYYWQRIFPTCKVPTYYLANIYHEENNLEEAKRLYIDAFKTPHYEESFDYNMTMGVIEVKEHKLDQAKYHLGNALTMDPNNTFLLTHLGIVAMLQKDDALAESYFQRAVQNKLEVLGRLDYAALRLSQNNLQGAADLYKEILLVEPTNQIALVNLIQIYLQQKDKENTLKIARILAQHSHDPVILKNVDLIFQRYKER